MDNENLLNIIDKYLKTLIRKNILNIGNNVFLKKPYLQNCLIKISCIIDEKILADKILFLLEHNKITNEDIFEIVKNSIINDKNIDNLQKHFLEDNENNNENNKLLLYQIKYFRLFHIITELLFDINNKNNYDELYYFILLYINNNKSEIIYYSNKNFKFKIFNYYLNDLYDLYKIIIQLLNISYDVDIFNLFLKNIFSKWYFIYKDDVINNKINDIIKNYKIKNSSILSRILCMNNL